jgi:hypothetical protein
MIKSISWVVMALWVIVLIASEARADSRCENTSWNYCGQALDKCCPSDRPYACINVRTTMQGAVTRGEPITTVPRGWSGCVAPATPISQAAWANNCSQFLLCQNQK